MPKKAKNYTSFKNLQFVLLTEIAIVSTLTMPTNVDHVEV